MTGDRDASFRRVGQPGEWLSSGMTLKQQRSVHVRSSRKTHKTVPFLPSSLSSSLPGFPCLFPAHEPNAYALTLVPCLPRRGDPLLVSAALRPVDALVFRFDLKPRRSLLHSQYHTFNWNGALTHSGLTRGDYGLPTSLPYPAYPPRTTSTTHTVSPTRTLFACVVRADSSVSPCSSINAEQSVQMTLVPRPILSDERPRSPHVNLVITALLDAGCARPPTPIVRP
jgi:hypothetical protein